MSLRLPPLSALRAFEAAARLRSFKGAGAELAVTATAISHRIRALEQALERPLFLRKVRAVELTADGEVLFVAVNSGLQTIAAAVEQVRGARRACVVVSATPAFASKWLVPKLSALQAAHPQIDLHVHASDAPADLEAGVADLAIRYGPADHACAGATVLLDDHFAAVASPALAATLADDSARWPLIHFDWYRAPPPELTWAGWAHRAGHAPDSMSAGIRYSQESHAIQAAIAGQGVALLSLRLVEEELRMGVLRIVAGPRLPGMAYRLLMPERRRARAAALAVRDWLLQTACRYVAPSGT
ncbi:LysR substrate-binding domain-containing protein [Xanthomonas rydalmerensis]|uniref:LysR substrate-binding domain-containing protein n=1 Tax=Xanthomonas rydalmerensis TaxID=3046274 RepID=A0ABZ0JQL8_9XANT|nr:LysR substrate-binding domain-containing protein [Xanthomonas sp. DM-2023]WOS42111.1 LysR substrate-binding domain-containing protein [Xanthomonas sp. DM-2023]WOS46297.1 LysR substrate-binding domain-containing protein [Xanthomonas sp. DM-2023]WOS50476.1 LysR substrate-binding domain-containing protein [Xanthomonas sp. DM-2023]WOS54656.1 LysR substrate-binding domain-containing protein [Xanthomonas sp. DM-2023]WOS58839.1 LysR substrate-binding domain-containing protein [Xanthomonas sp. DM-2